MKKGIIMIGMLACIGGTASAQDEYDALRYGYTQYFGTARGISIGNAMGSVGGDFSSLSVNPAGIGIYRKGEVVFSPAFNVSSNKGTYLGNTTGADASKLNMSQFGIVFTSAKKGNLYKKSAWKTGSFAFGLNRMANFKNEYVYSGVNTNNSLIDKYAEEFNSLGGINAVNSVSYPAYAAYQTWLIDRGFNADSNKAVSYVPAYDGIRQTKRVYEKGGMHEFVISGGGNYQEKLMLGATLGIPRVSYERTLQFDEEDVSGKTNNDFKYMYFTETLNTTGTGINLKLGAIIKPNDLFRLGIAFHTPSYIQFNDVSSIAMESHTDSLLLYNNPGGNPITRYIQDTALSFNYTQTTPYRALLSSTVLFKQYGFLTADLEYVGYSAMRYDYGIGYENESNVMNTTIGNTYKNAINVRVGGEAKLQNVALRAGVAYYGSPYKNSAFDAARTNISGGVGYRGKSWFLDLAYVYSAQNYLQTPYTLRTETVSNASIKNTTSSVVMTLGLKFL